MLDDSFNCDTVSCDDYRRLIQEWAALKKLNSNTKDELQSIAIQKIVQFASNEIDLQDQYIPARQAVRDLVTKTRLSGKISKKLAKKEGIVIPKKEKDGVPVPVPLPGGDILGEILFSRKPKCYMPTSIEIIHS